MDMKDSKMDQSTHTMVSTDITTLNYSMLKAPQVTTLPRGSSSRMHFELTGNESLFVEYG
jgi:hypothetical protein